MSFTSSLAFFDHLMNEGVLDEAALVAFLAKATSDEGLHLDFKSGQELDKPKDKRNFTVRQYGAAFANSEGGVLVVGVGDDKALDPITTSHEGKVGGDLTGWAARCVSELIGYLGVPPRFSVVDVAGGKVLLIAVPRAPSLVPVIKEGKQAYYFRVEDEAREVYPHLVSDLLLGRRQTPGLTARAEFIARRHPPEGKRRKSVWPNLALQADVLELDGSIIVTNESIVAASGMSGGLVALGLDAGGEHERGALLGDLRSRLTLPPARDVAQERFFHWPLAWAPTEADDRRCNTITMRPFEAFRASPRRERQEWLCPDDRQRYAVALYLVPDRCEPIWFELVLELGGKSWSDTDGERVAVTVERTSGRRPSVGVVPPEAAT